MSNSARSIKLRIEAPRPRNPLVAPTRQRKAGKHENSKKTERQTAKRSLKRDLGGD